LRGLEGTPTGSKLRARLVHGPRGKAPSGR